MEDPDTEIGWTKPKQSFKLKKTISRGRAGSSSIGNKTLPELCTKSVKRRNPFGFDDDNAHIDLNNRIKKPKIGDIFSPSSAFLDKKASLTRIGAECFLGDTSRGKLD